jgi:hypothetical protein
MRSGVQVHIRAGELGVTKVGRYAEHMLVDLIVAEGTRLERGYGPAVPQIM